MAIKLSTGASNKMLSMIGALKAFISGATLAYVDGGASPDSITDSGNGLISAGFSPNDLIWTKNATTPGNNLNGVAVTGVSAGALTIASGIVAGAEAFPANGCIIACKGGSLRDIFKDGILRLYTGTVPATADAAITGTKVLEITLNSVAFVPGAFDNGLEFGDAAAGVLAKVVAEVWSGVGIAPGGTVTHYRLCGNALDNDALSTALPRIQGTVGISGADLNMSSVSVVAGATTTIDTFSYSLTTA